MMSSPTPHASKVVLITGVSRGIGRALLQEYLLRPYHTIIGTIRSSHHNDALHALPTAYGSKLILVDLESRSGTDPARVVAEIRATADITHLDMVIANAGVAPKPGPLETITPKDLYDAFGINVVAPVLLYQACRQLLEMAEKPIWVTMSSAAGSVSMLEGFGIPSLFAYGASKAAVNWFTVAMHTAHPKWIATAVYPGFVGTDMGNDLCKQMGLPPPPDRLETSIEKTMAFLDQATRENASGKLYDVIADKELLF